MGPFSSVGRGARIGDRTIIHPNVCIGEGAVVGDDCVIHSHVAIRERVVIGNRVIIQNGAVIGSDGYGFVKRSDGTYQKIPQTAGVIVEDDVEIGANTTVDRGAIVFEVCHARSNSIRQPERWPARRAHATIPPCQPRTS